MSNREDKIKADKFALIYEFNNNSPLFSRVASTHLEQGELGLAVPILEKGIKDYPDYATGKIMYALSLAMGGKKDAAKEVIQSLSETFGLEETVKHYLNKIDNLPEEPASIEIAEATIPEPEITDEQPVTELAENQDEEHPDEGDVNIEEENDEIDDDLEELAERLKNASIPVINDQTGNLDMLPDEEESAPVSDKSLVSETLAKIYFNQGNFKEALAIYETLIDIQPHKKEHYQKLIEQIEEHMRDS